MVAHAKQAVVVVVHVKQAVVHVRQAVVHVRQAVVHARQVVVVVHERQAVVLHCRNRAELKHLNTDDRAEADE